MAVILIISQLDEAAISAVSTTTTGQNNLDSASNEGLLALAAAINNCRSPPSGLRTKFKEAMAIFNRDWADKIDAPRALDKWEVSEMACLRFIHTRPQDRLAYFETFVHRPSESYRDY